MGFELFSHGLGILTQEGGDPDLFIGSVTGALLSQWLIDWPEYLRAGRGTARLVLSGAIIAPIISSIIVFPCWWRMTTFHSRRA